MVDFFTVGVSVSTLEPRRTAGDVGGTADGVLQRTASEVVVDGGTAGAGSCAVVLIRA